MLDAFLSGAAFGAALGASGVYQPAVILAQMKMQDFRMMQTFFVASAASTVIVAAGQQLGYLHLKPRSYSSLGLLGPLDGNILGGAMLGIGMTLTGSCPGTVFAQVGAGMQSGLYVLGGGILGGILWSGVLRPALARLKSKTKGVAPSPDNLSLYGAMGTSRTMALAGVEALFGCCIALISVLGLVTTRGYVSPIVGGGLIAAAQLFSAMTRGALLGTSSSFEEVGDLMIWLLGAGSKPKGFGSLTLVIGMITGMFALSKALKLPTTSFPEPSLGPGRLVLGGVLLVLGSRMGGGCTSGHGISGISLLSVSSFVSVLAMFAGAFATAAL
ncbi:hypothetical protein GGR57DRAFT_476367, partial [Xylariaceae sp. FL1272]